MSGPSRPPEKANQHRWFRRLQARFRQAAPRGDCHHGLESHEESIDFSCQPVVMPWPGQRNLWTGKCNERDDESLRYYFIHIPKTAGTSLIAVLDRLFPQARIFPAQLWRELTPELVAQASQFDFFRGHFGGGGLKVFPQAAPRTLTMLRDPLSLSVSTYHFVRREKGTRLHQLVMDEQLTLPQFVSDKRTCHLIENRQVRYLSFDIQEDPAGQDIFLSEQSQAVVQQWLPNDPPRLDDTQRYERAKRCLQACDWFGLQERFDDSLRLLAWQLGLPPLGGSDRLNVNPAQSTVDEKTRQAILRQNHWDQQLYAWACAEFERRMTAMQESLAPYRSSPEDTLDDLLRQRYRQGAEERLKKLPGSQWPRRWDGDFAEPVAGSQWHRREIALPQRRWFRWTGPGRVAESWYLLTPADYTMTLEILNGLSSHDLDQLQLQVNGQPLDYRIVLGAGKVVRTIQAQVPATLFGNSPLLRLECELPRTATHAETFGSSDQRRVGMAVQSIQWQPSPG